MAAVNAASTEDWSEVTAATLAAATLAIVASKRLSEVVFKLVKSLLIVDSKAPASLALAARSFKTVTMEGVRALTALVTLVLSAASKAAVFSVSVVAVWMELLRVPSSEARVRSCSMFPLKLLTLLWRVATLLLMVLISSRTWAVVRLARGAADTRETPKRALKIVLMRTILEFWTLMIRLE